ncbi:MAG: GTA-gp10 family protein [Henriciella sp.]|nr:GTA-gp10 family protein [Henriciella sp.]
MIGARGELALDVDGATHVLCLTLGALAEMETLFGCTCMEDLQARLKRLSAAELMTVVEILLRAGGCSPETASQASNCTPPGKAAEAVARAFRAALG